MLNGMEQLFGQFKPAVPVLPPPSFLPSPNLLPVGAKWGAEKAFSLRMWISGSKNIGDISTVLVPISTIFAHKNMAPYGLHEENEFHLMRAHTNIKNEQKVC